MPRYNIALLRKESGMTQQELASRLNLSQGHLSSVETGRNPFPIERVEDLQKLFPDKNLEDYLLEEETIKSGYEVGNNNSDSHIHINGPEALKTLISMVAPPSIEDRNKIEFLSSEISTLHHRIEKLSERNERLMDKIEKANQHIYELMEENNALTKLLAEHGISPQAKLSI